MMMRVWCRVASSRLLLLLLLLLEAGPRHLASLGLLHVAGGELHVRVAHPLAVKLLLRPEAEPQTDRKLALAGLGVFRLKDGGVQLAGHLLSVGGLQQVC